MSKQYVQRELPPLPGLVAGTLVFGGMLLWMLVGKEWLFVVGLGAFGPGILREFGILRDQDEFQRQAAHRAGYHAYLVGGLVAVVLLSALELRGPDLPISVEWLSLVLLVLWMAWLFSSLLAYWGAQRTTARLLVTFGSFWTIFVIASLVGETVAATPPTGFWSTLKGVAAGFGLVAPFFGLAWAAGRWPRTTGALLFLAAAGLFGLTARPGNLAWSTVLLTQTLLVVPLVASGIALLGEDRADS